MEITLVNKSVEHILPNACGGKLKSSKLLCRECNKNFGATYDAVLAEQTNNLANLLKIKRDRGVPNTIKGKIGSTEENILISFDGKLRKLKPEIDITKDGDKILLSIEARNMAEFLRIAKGLKKKYPGLDIEQLKKDAIDKSGYLNDYITINETIGGDAVFRSLTKSAINYFIHTGGKREHIIHLLPYLNGVIEKDVVNFHLVNDRMYTYKPGEVSHIIHLAGSNEASILYCYIELFNCHGYLILLNENYDGPDINELYVYDLLMSEVKKRKIPVKYNREEVLKFIAADKSELLSEFEKHFTRVIQIAGKKQDDEHIRNISESIAKEVFKELPEGAAFDETMLARLADIGSKKMAKFLLHKQNAGLRQKE